jgi:hypothetical protein
MEHKFFEDVDINLDELLTNGFIRLDQPLNNYCDLTQYTSIMVEQIGNQTFTEKNSSHLELLSKLGVFDILLPKLFQLASEKLGYKGSLNDQYHVARIVRSYNNIEKYRGHFDSHLFTLVLPLHIPDFEDDCENGELIFLPNARKQPLNEFINIVEKLYFKKYSSKSGMRSLGFKSKLNVELFEENKPLLFVGNTTFHANKALQGDFNKMRLTLLSHFFDPSPSWGIGNLMRKLRAR